MGDVRTVEALGLQSDITSAAFINGRALAHRRWGRIAVAERKQMKPIETFVAGYRAAHRQLRPAPHCRAGRKVKLFTGNCRRWVAANREAFVLGL